MKLLVFWVAGGPVLPGTFSLVEDKGTLGIFFSYLFTCQHNHSASFTSFHVYLAISHSQALFTIIFSTYVDCMFYLLIEFLALG